MSKKTARRDGWVVGGGTEQRRGEERRRRPGGGAGKEQAQAQAQAQGQARNGAEWRRAWSARVWMLGTGRGPLRTRAGSWRAGGQQWSARRADEPRWIWRAPVAYVSHAAPAQGPLSPGAPRRHPAYVRMSPARGRNGERVPPALARARTQAAALFLAGGVCGSQDKEAHGLVYLGTGAL